MTQRVIIYSWAPDHMPENLSTEQVEALARRIKSALAAGGFDVYEVEISDPEDD